MAYRSRGASDAISELTSTVVDCTASTLTLDAVTHANKVVVQDRAAGTTITLPAATGTGDRYFVVCKTTITSNSLKVQVADATDVMNGLAYLAADAGDTVVVFANAADSDTITLNGTTTGGIAGASIEAIDIGTNLWFVRVASDASGAEATPFSAAVA